MKSSSKRLDPIIRVKKAERAARQEKVVRAQHEVNQNAIAASNLAEQIERLAGEMKANKRGPRLKLESLKQIDELMELLRLQSQELLTQADDANEVLEACQGELLRVDQGVRTLERLKEIRGQDVIRQSARRKRAA